MKKQIITTLAIVLTTMLNAQIPGYYNGTEGKKGDELKAALHEIINDHVDFSYSDAKYVLEYAQEDPANSANLIQFYTNRSVKKGSSSWGTGGDYLNREHIWAQSHGSLSGNRPMDGDAFNLHAADASVNVTRSNYDFDYVVGGTAIAEADASYGGGAFEPSDRDKGEVARTLMYMAVRYEGDKGEMDLELADVIGTAPSATHGKLSSLLEWNNAFPPTDFERRRNDRVEQCQRNRNPFIDNPALADLIWGSAEPKALTIGGVQMMPKDPKAGDAITVQATIQQLQSAKLRWGSSYSTMTNEVANVSTSASDHNFEVTFTPSGISGEEMVYCQLIAQSATEADTMFFNFYLLSDMTPVSIAAVQGTGATSPLANNVVAIEGIVTANFDNVFTMQTSANKREGVTVYTTFRGRIGDSIKVVGKAVEYYGLTEISPVTSLYNYGYVGELAPLTVGIADINEDYEGVLVELKGVSFKEGGSDFPSGDTYPYPTFTVTDGVNDIVFYTRYDSRLNEMPIPNGTVNIKAVVSEYKGIYQIMSYDTTWFTAATDITPPMVVSVEVTEGTNNRAWVLVNFNEIVNEDDVKEEANFSISGGVAIARNYYDAAKPNQAKVLVDNISVGEHTLIVKNIHDAFGNVLDSVAFDFTSSISAALSAQEAERLVSLYPVPVSSGNMTVTAAEMIQSLSVYALNGQVLMTAKNVNATQKELSLSAFEVGNYLLQVQMADKVVTRQFSIQ